MLFLNSSLLMSFFTLMGNFLFHFNFLFLMRKTTHVSDPGLLPASLPPRRSGADPSCGLCVTAGAYSQGAGENQLLSSFLVIW